MKKTILTYGLISGVIASTMMFSYMMAYDSISFETGAVIGYTSIVLSFTLVFFGIRSYRDNFSQGTLSFGKGFKIGVLIALISSICYVITWLIVYYNFMPDFMDRYTNHVIEKMKEGGASQMAVEQKVLEMKQFGEMYKNPLVVIAFTFLEPFPIGLLIAAISALILKKKNSAALAT